MDSLRQMVSMSSRALPLVWLCGYGTNVARDLDRLRHRRAINIFQLPNKTDLRLQIVPLLPRDNSLLC